MASIIQHQSGFHESQGPLRELQIMGSPRPDGDTENALAPSAAAYGGVQFTETYTFKNLFHPMVGKLRATLNRQPLAKFFTSYLGSNLESFFDKTYDPQEPEPTEVDFSDTSRLIDVTPDGPYANYNWELFFHVPLTVAVHLSKTQRFAEAQRWFHFIFNPLNATSSSAPARKFWNFLPFRKTSSSKRIEDIITILSTPRAELADPDDQALQDEVLNGYDAIRNKPFQPHAVARTRYVAYQFQVIMKYLDNLIAWGDHLFQQDTIETINEATQLYVLAANILGPRPQQIPPRGTVRAKSFAQLKAQGLGPIGNALVELEGQFPFNLAAPQAPAEGGDNSVLFGIGRTLYFCLPRNDKLLGYWDRVADRLFKIRHCMNLQGIVRPLALFDPPIDPGLLVKAAAAGLNVSEIVAGLNQPVSPVRCQLLIQKALELCGEVRGLGGALLAAVEKGDAEKLALLRQKHEIKLQTLAQDVRFLQWKAAEESTTSLLTTRKTALERLRFYQQLLGLPADPNVADTITLDRRDLDENGFDAAYASLVQQYDRVLDLQDLPALNIAGQSPSSQSGASGQGSLRLVANEDDELNQRLPAARDERNTAAELERVASVLAIIPDVGLNFHFWGLGGHLDVIGGTKLSAASRYVAEIHRTRSAREQDQAGISSRTASYERRAHDWVLQYNLAAHELMQNGRQILSGLIAEQVARHEYENLNNQIKQAQEVDQLLHEKFSNEDLYGWMQGEISRLYYEYYRFAVDTARKAERTMKLELMRPEVDAQEFVKFNYWDGGRKGLLSGEALYLDVKRMELAYHEHNKRELELTKHVSLRQLDPLALLTLKATGSCQVTVPEWLYDLDAPGHYLRRIKTVALSIPAVAGPYTGVNCTLSLLRSSLRKSPDAGGQYARQGVEDERFIDYTGAIQSIVTSGGQNDSGLFEVNLRDERFLPFEGAGAESTWRLDLPKDYRAFDYDTISDVIVHVRYTARPGVEPGKVKAALDARFKQAAQSNLGVLLDLRHEFPSEWAAFVNGSGDFTAVIRRDVFPYFTHGRKLSIARLDLYAGDVGKHHVAGAQADWDAASAALADPAQQAFTFKAAADQPGPTQVLTRDPESEVFLLVRYTLT